MPRMIVTDKMRDSKTPSSVDVRAEAREPITDPTLGKAVPAPVGPAPKHRLVTIGDSITHGYQSGAIYATEISYPRIIAHEMGWSDHFRYPRYGGPGGLPFNIEFVIRRLERVFGDRIDWWEALSAAVSLRSQMDEIEDYWERGPGSTSPNVPDIHHNLGIYGWDLRDALSRTAGVCAAAIERPKDNWFLQVVENANDRAAVRVLPHARAGEAGESMVSAAETLGNDGGIETLIVYLGANNALGAVVKLEVVWSQAGDSGKDYQDLKKKKAFTIWDPEHFAIELAELVARVKRINAQRVIWATVPHLTVAPVARGVSTKVRTGSRYFPYYTRAWISDGEFSPTEDKNITAAEARAIDSAIDQYNDAIVAQVRDARGQEGRSWFVLDTAGILDRLAARRYIDDPAAQPPWWKPYRLPDALKALSPPPDSRFFVSDAGGRRQGGLFSLDGVHPTTIAYGLVAQEFMNIMELAGVPFYGPDGKTLRKGQATVDFTRLIALDTLISAPPRSLSADLSSLGWIDQKIDLFKRLF